MSKSKSIKEQLYMLVDRCSNKIYHNNISYAEGTKLLLDADFPNKMLIVIKYKFRSHPTMGWIWMPI